jgi:hypothetical protein
MSPVRLFPYLVAGYVLFTGVFFGLAQLAGAAFLSAEAPGLYYTYALAGILAAAGIVFMWRLRRGDLKKRGKTVVEVRREAIANVKDPQLLARVVREDEHPEVREIAKKRLKEIAE